MGKKRTKKKSKPIEASPSIIKQKTVVWLSLTIALVCFVGGTIFSSIKLAPESGGGSQNLVSPSSINFEALEAEALKNQENADAWTRLGNAYFDSEQYQKAIEAYNKSVAIDPGNPNVLTDLGVMYRRNKQPQKAVEMFSKAMAVDAKHEFSRMNKGIVLLHDLNDKDSAIKAWEDLPSINPLAVFGDGQSVDSVVYNYKQ
jgi:uncharacterized protein HemY